MLIVNKKSWSIHWQSLASYKTLLFSSFGWFMWTIGNPRTTNKVVIKKDCCRLFPLQSFFIQEIDREVEWTIASFRKGHVWTIQLTTLSNAWHFIETILSFPLELIRVLLTLKALRTHPKDLFFGRHCFSFISQQK